MTSEVNIHQFETMTKIQCDIPEPNNLAKFDSFSFAAAIGGDMLSDFMVL